MHVHIALLVLGYPLASIAPLVLVIPLAIYWRRRGTKVEMDPSPWIIR